MSLLDEFEDELDMTLELENQTSEETSKPGKIYHNIDSAAEAVKAAAMQSLGSQEASQKNSNGTYHHNNNSKYVINHKINPPSSQNNNNNNNQTDIATNTPTKINNSQNMSTDSGAGANSQNTTLNSSSVTSVSASGSASETLKSTISQAKSDPKQALLVKQMQINLTDCTYYMMGTCYRGEGCYYRHCLAAKNSPEDAICKVWLETQFCKLDCPLRHPRPAHIAPGNFNRHKIAKGQHVQDGQIKYNQYNNIHQKNNFNNNGLADGNKPTYNKTWTANGNNKNELTKQVSDSTDQQILEMDKTAAKTSLTGKVQANTHSVNEAALNQDKISLSNSSNGDVKNGTIKKETADEKTPEQKKIEEEQELLRKVQRQISGFEDEKKKRIEEKELTTKSDQTEADKDRIRQLAEERRNEQENMLQLKQRATSGGYKNGRRTNYNNPHYRRDLRADAPVFKPKAATEETKNEAQPNLIQPNLSAAASIGLLAQQLLDPNAMLLAAQAQLLLAGAGGAAGGLPNPSSLPLPPGKGNDSSDLDLDSNNIKEEQTENSNNNKITIKKEADKSVKRKPSSTSVSSNNDLQKGFENVLKRRRLGENLSTIKQETDGVNESETFTIKNENSDLNLELMSLKALKKQAKKDKKAKKLAKKEKKLEKKLKKQQAKEMKKEKKKSVKKRHAVGLGEALIK